MQKDCEHLRVRLEMEYTALQDWRKALGLATHTDEQEFPDSLKAHKYIVIAVLAQIQTLMTDFAELNGRYVELQPKTEAANPSTGQGQQNAALAEASLSYETLETEKKHARGFNHILRGLSMVKNAASHPRKLRWVEFDSDVFKALLAKLHELNGYLRNLLHGQEARALEVATRQTSLELVQVRTSVQELKYLIVAWMLLNEHHASEQDKALETLAKLKQIRADNDAPDQQKTPDYENLVQSTEILAHSAISYSEDGQKDTAPHRKRTNGKYSPSSETTVPVWIEWKSYKIEFRGEGETIPLTNDVNRVRELVALLMSEKPSEFCTPRCLGYFDDHKDSTKGQTEFRFGLVYEKPGENVSPTSLHDMIRQIPMPTLSERIQLAHKSATCILYLHAVNWLHKAFRSDSILMYPKDDTFDFKQPSITGYEYARPDRNEETTTGAASNPWWEPYAHPNYQGDRARGSYRKTYDIYSLGIVLLEIAYWRSIEQIMKINPPEARTSEFVKIRERLLARGSEYQEHVRANLGTRYCTAMTSCLDGRDAFGIGETETESSVETGVKLQKRFTTLVVDSLEQIRV